MARFRFTISGEYTIPDDRLVHIYGTTDLAECAAIDALNDDVAFFLTLSDDVAFEVRPA